MKRNPTAEALIPELAEFADALEEFERAYGLEPKVTHEQDQTCPMCGARQICSPSRTAEYDTGLMVRKRKAPWASVMALP
jgi:hypothetical protein